MKTGSSKAVAGAGAETFWKSEPERKQIVSAPQHCCHVQAVPSRPSCPVYTAPDVLIRVYPPGYPAVAVQYQFCHLTVSVPHLSFLRCLVEFSFPCCYVLSIMPSPSYLDSSVPFTLSQLSRPSCLFPSFPVSAVLFFQLRFSQLFCLSCPGSAALYQLSPLSCLRWSLVTFLSQQFASAGLSLLSFMFWPLPFWSSLTTISFLEIKITHDRLCRSWR